MCLVPAGAHFFELANKMSMSPPEYMTVQKIYAGWSFFGIAVIAALVLILTYPTGLLFSFDPLDDDAIVKWTEFHDLPPNRLHIF
jgi:hypothetical protein